nr:hypothetical protein [Methanobrevibacter arboriphilus]
MKHFEGITEMVYRTLKNADLDYQENDKFMEIIGLATSYYIETGSSEMMTNTHAIIRAKMMEKEGEILEHSSKIQEDAFVEKWGLEELYSIYDFDKK